MKVLVVGDDANLRGALTKICEVISIEHIQPIKNDYTQICREDSLHGKRRGKRKHGRNNDLDLARRYSK